jgi:Zn-dependent protease
MRGSLKLFTWFGIPVFLHWSFGLIFLYILWYANDNELSLSETTWMTGLFMALFLCVLLHEYGHALAARRYGVNTRDIVLMPIGGVARLERMPEKPFQEFVVAIAGPMVNVIIAVLLFAGIWLFSQPEYLEALRIALQTEAGEMQEDVSIELPQAFRFVLNLAVTNVALVIFNMIPAFPMDGGRVFRALLSMRIGRPRATRIAALLGQGIAILLGAYGLWSGNFMLPVLSLFVIYAARSENDSVQMEDFLTRYHARDVLRPQFTRLRSTDWMLSAIEQLRHGLERHFLVFDLADHLVGSLEEDDIVKAMRKPDVTTEISRYLQKAELININDPLLRAFYFIRQRGYGIVGVVDEQGNLAGVIDEAGLHNFIRLGQKKA